MNYRPKPCIFWEAPELCLPPSKIDQGNTGWPTPQSDSETSSSRWKTPSSSSSCLLTQSFSTSLVPRKHFRKDPTRTQNEEKATSPIFYPCEDHLPKIPKTEHWQPCAFCFSWGTETVLARGTFEGCLLRVYSSTICFCSTSQYLHVHSKLKKTMTKTNSWFWIILKNGTNKSIVQALSICPSKLRSPVIGRLPRTRRLPWPRLFDEKMRSLSPREASHLATHSTPQGTLAQGPLRQHPWASTTQLPQLDQHLESSASS